MRTSRALLKVLAEPPAIAVTSLFVLLSTQFLLGLGRYSCAGVVQKGVLTRGWGGPRQHEELGGFRLWGINYRKYRERKLSCGNICRRRLLITETTKIYRRTVLNVYE